MQILPSSAEQNWSQYKTPSSDVQRDVDVNTPNTSVMDVCIQVCLAQCQTVNKSARIGKHNHLPRDRIAAFKTVARMGNHSPHGLDSVTARSLRFLACPSIKFILSFFMQHLGVLARA